MMGVLEQQKLANENRMRNAMSNIDFGMIRQEPSMADRALGVARRMFWGESDPRKRSVLDSEFVPMKGAPAKYEGVGMDLVMPAITAFHGSPHKFSKFDMSKIGTGEGAQAYGHGLYFAENPKVAKEYAKMSPMVDASPNRTFLGKELSPGTPEYHAGTLLEQSGMTIPKAKREVQGWIDEHIAQRRPQEDQAFQGWKKTLETLNQAKKKSDFGLGRKDNLYKVDIPDDQIAKMLDWDKPLSEQPKYVREILKKEGYDRERLYDTRPNTWGSSVYTNMMNNIDQRKRLGKRGASEATAKELKRIGISGIKYLDQGSRQGGKGTSNFVVFDDQIPQILEINDNPLVQNLMR